MKSSGIGGQAVMEGVMMKNKDNYAVAVRKSDNTIEIKKETHKSLSSKNAFFRLPIIRGVVNFIDSMVLGVSTLTYSASFYEEEEVVEPTKLEKAFAKVFKSKAEDIAMGFCVLLSLIIAIGVFMILPLLATNFLAGVIKSTNIQILVEGIIRIALFILYVFLISFMKDIKRTFMYHGAEHKTINCVENGYELTVENVRRQSKQHKRCGTSFLLIVMFVSVIFFMFIRCEEVWLKIILRVLLVPVIAGVSYEFLKLCGSSDNKIICILAKPGLWLQALTTREPDDLMIEVAIASVEAVFDWKPYIEKVNEEKSKIAKYKRKHSKHTTTRTESDEEYLSEKMSKYDEPDELDEILNALDKMFIEQEEKDGDDFSAKPSVDSEPAFVRSRRYVNQSSNAVEIEEAAETIVTETKKTSEQEFVTESINDDELDELSSLDVVMTNDEVQEVTDDSSAEASDNNSHKNKANNNRGKNGKRKKKKH